MKQKHWNENDFVQTETSPAYDGSDAVNRFGYCRVCKADMQSFADAGENGPLLHYKSRSTWIRQQKRLRRAAQAEMLR